MQGLVFDERSAARRRMTSSLQPFTALPDGFAARSNARRHPLDRHSSVQGWALKHSHPVLNAGGAIRNLKPDLSRQNTRQKPPRPSSAAPFRSGGAHRVQVGRTRKTSPIVCLRDPPRHRFRPRPGRASFCSKRGRFHSCNIKWKSDAPPANNYSLEEKIRIVLHGLRGEQSIADGGHEE